jgi:predicted P-loop ATPase
MAVKPLPPVVAASAEDEPPPRLDDQTRQQANGKGNGHSPTLEDEAPATPEPKPKKGKRRGLNALRLVSFMAAHAEWKNALRINLFTGTMEVATQFPPNGKPLEGYRPFNEPGDLLESMLWFQNEGYPTASKNLTWDVLSIAASRNAYHPVKEYLDSLTWDGEHRLGRLFQHYFNGDTHIEDNASEDDRKHTDRMVAYLENTSLCFMVSAVARIRNPGCKVDHVPVLTGRQRLGKSRGIRALCRDPAWFSDDLSADVSSKDTKDSLSGKWLIELSEMPHAKREVERVKAFFSGSNDRYRKAYDKLTRDYPRECAFFGSSNDLQFLDKTGNRRWWPIEVTGPIDENRIAADRDQLWAEAVALYEGGYRWWLAPNIEAIAAEQQAEFQEHDIWTDHLETWAEGRAYPFTLADAMTDGLGFPDPKQIPKADQIRAAGCLTSLGYRRRRARKGAGHRPWQWVKEDA